jgi:hypothetical protein
MNIEEFQITRWLLPCSSKHVKSIFFHVLRKNDHVPPLIPFFRNLSFLLLFQYAQIHLDHMNCQPTCRLLSDTHHFESDLV